MCWSRILNSNFTLESLEKLKKKNPHVQAPSQTNWIRIFESGFKPPVFWNDPQSKLNVEEVEKYCAEASKVVRKVFLIQLGRIREMCPEKLELKLTFKECKREKVACGKEEHDF